MKPSQKVIETIKKLIHEDWEKSADKVSGYKLEEETFNDIIRNSPEKKLEYTASAIIIVMDEMAEKTKAAGMGFGDLF